MSGRFATANPHRIKAAHRRRRKVASGQSVQRYYDPQIGRFLSVDPVSADGSTGGNFNRYWYGANNSYRFTDPDGRICTGSRIEDRNGNCASTGGPTTQSASAPSGRVSNPRSSAGGKLPYSPSNVHQRFNAANRDLKKILPSVMAKRTKSADGIHVYFSYRAQPISTKYTVEIFYHSSPSENGWKIVEAHVANEFWSDSGIGGGQSGTPVDLGETGGHMHPFNTPFSPGDISNTRGIFYVSRPNGSMSVYNPYLQQTRDLEINLWDY